MMDCGEARELLAACADDELPSGERSAVLVHLQGCAGCSAALADLQTLRARIRAAGTFAPPAGLESVVRDAIGLESRRQAAPGWRRYVTLAASHAAVALLAAAVAFWLTARSDLQTAATRDIVGAHVRALLDGRLVQVASSDTHTVRPWFAGRVPFAPEVVDLAPRGFPLIGARVDYVMDRPAAALVYERRKHRITVFVIPQEQANLAGGFELTRNGYNVVAWRHGGFAYFAASDLNVGELRELAGALGGS